MTSEIAINWDINLPKYSKVFQIGTVKEIAVNKLHAAMIPNPMTFRSSLLVFQMHFEIVSIIQNSFIFPCKRNGVKIQFSKFGRILCNVNHFLLVFLKILLIYPLVEQFLTDFFKLLEIEWNILIAWKCENCIELPKVAFKQLGCSANAWNCMHFRTVRKLLKLRALPEIDQHFLKLTKLTWNCETFEHASIRNCQNCARKKGKKENCSTLHTEIAVDGNSVGWHSFKLIPQ